MSEDFDQKSFFIKCRKLLEEKDYNSVLLNLLEALRLNKLDVAETLKAGRMIDQMDIDGAINVFIVGQLTTAWIASALQASAAARGVILSIDEAPYDNVMQSLVSLRNDADVVILLPWHQRLFSADTRSADQRIGEEIDFWQQAWRLIKKSCNARIIQLGYDWIDSGASGQFWGGYKTGEVSMIRTLNMLLRESLPNLAYFIDLEQVSGVMGRHQFYDARSYYWTKQPFSEEGNLLLSRYLWAGIRASTTGPKKVLVLDLDNTLWGGVVGEVGASGIELGDNPTGEAFRSFQKLVKQLKENGCLLAVCSKNNEADAREPFERNPDMILSLNDFVAFKACWEPKSKIIKQISSELNLGLDSFVFFDDSVIEQEEIRGMLPEVEVVDVPADPADYRKALLDGLWFEALSITEEDKQRTLQYQHEFKRAESCTAFDKIEDYLSSLEMLADIRLLNEDDIDRAVQLAGKTNQFNLTTKRYSQEEILAAMTQPDAKCFTLRLHDRFGDYGLVSLLFSHIGQLGNESGIVIDAWLMSCRVISRTVEHFLYNHLLIEARKLKVKYIFGHYIPTKKNVLVKDFYKELGFVPVNKIAESGQWYKLNVYEASDAITFVSG